MVGIILSVWLEAELAAANFIYLAASGCYYQEEYRSQNAVQVLFKGRVHAYWFMGLFIGLYAYLFLKYGFSHIATEMEKKYTIMSILSPVPGIAFMYCNHSNAADNK